MSIRAGAGLSRAAGAEEAAREAVGRALDQLGGARADAALLFPTAELADELPRILRIVREVADAPAQVGCTAVGCLTLDGEVERAPGLACLLLASDQAALVPVLFEDLQAQGEGLGAAVGRKLKTTLGAANLFVALPDPRGFFPPFLFQGLAGELGHLPVVGGLASGPEDGAIWQFNGDAAVEHALSGLLIAGRFGMEIGVAHGCAPIGKPYVITRSKGNILQQLGGRPTMEILREALEDATEEKGYESNSVVFAGLAIDPSAYPLQRGDFVVRNLLGYDKDSGALAINDLVRVGQTLQFQIRDPAVAHADMRATAEKMKKRLGERRPAFGLYFDCISRGRTLFEGQDHDVGILREVFGDFPLVGFFGNGEIAPAGRRNFLHAYTGVLVIVTAE
ncbi:MAG: FIST C-terminal domain-containing protein [Planctomycetes bacterium]|nr:FIST C-terminal domain-containing protein [Planctomycetota bacterium]